MIRIEAAFWDGAPFNAARALAAAQANGAAVERKGLLWIVTTGERRLSLFPDGHLLVHDCIVANDALTVARALFTV
jgi:hypothetical protein